MEKLTAKDMLKLQDGIDERKVEEFFTKMYECAYNHAFKVKDRPQVGINIPNSALAGEAMDKMKNLGFHVYRDSSDDRRVVVSWAKEHTSKKDSK